MEATKLTKPNGMIKYILISEDLTETIIKRENVLLRGGVLPLLLQGGGGPLWEAHLGEVLRDVVPLLTVYHLMDFSRRVINLEIKF